MYAAQFLFVILLVCAQVDVVEGRRLPLDNALDDMRKRLQETVVSTEVITTAMEYTTIYGMDAYTDNPMNMLTSTSVTSPWVGTIVTPATFPDDSTSEFDSHSSFVRAVLNSIGRECTWGEDRCASIETEVAQVLNLARLRAGSAGPQTGDVASVIYLVICIVVVLVGLTGLALVLDRFLPAEAVYGGLSYVGHTVVDLLSGLWDFIVRRRGASPQFVEPMVAQHDGERRPLARVEPAPMSVVPGAAVSPSLYPAVFQVIYTFVILVEGQNQV